MLPIDTVLDDLKAVLARGANAVLVAPPGAGKTTRVPLALLDQPWITGKIVMLEPRRLAARASARRMAETLGEKVGETVGFRVRGESKVGPDTRIEVVTEGILTRTLLDDPELNDKSVIIFDEFHERSLQSDLGLALCLESQEALRDDLRLIVMSATIDGAKVADLMNAEVVSSEGRMFPVEARYGKRPEPRDLTSAVAATVRTALNEEEGSILAFLPGEREIKAVAEALAGVNADVRPLYGALGAKEQDAAIRPCAEGARKVVLATDIAETSLTIEGVRVVVDGGLHRAPRFDPSAGMTKLETRRVSKASSEQRAGRAGRLAPGVVYRLWPAPEQAALLPYAAPEIVEADLAPLALDLARWGVSDPGALKWLDEPPKATFAQARDLLHELGALADSRLTRHGEAMARIPAHPRLAHMMVRAMDEGLGGLACDVAALLEERDFLRGDADLAHRVTLLRTTNRAGRAKQTAATYRKRLKTDGGEPADTGRVLALAYPERVAKRRGQGRYLLAGGRGAKLDESDPLAAHDWLAVADMDARGAEGRIWRAAPLTLAEVEADFADLIEEGEHVGWDGRKEEVTFAHSRRLGVIVLKEKPLDNADPELIVEAMVEGVRAMGLESLPWSDDLRAWQARVNFLHGLDETWPDVSDAALMESLDWLMPFLTGLTKRAHLKRVDLKNALLSRLDWQQQRQLDDLAPTHIKVPSGSSIRLDYAAEDGPVLAVKLQEMFGCADTPTVAGQPVLVHLLSPARRPLQVTRDLKGFWAGSYAAVKAEMKGRYPKHPWPDDPMREQATRFTKRRAENRK